ncbi:hypothetical protein M670_01768 [Schinkia azotoformans MEV2011]|uniref:Uncharacterized protein n=1 Tax=Schinkia azotoformans MEV2011 TaxID=1348973 RepID=A0A072NNV7_SCHAZ|nr:type II toxin-antitoxin system PemK/MazF family toxin [Schinkia azotoformans]KEF38952.1 hypothetical protein M670_01768 [Schinkia azotoformans MEV2011]MEC1694485.1 type II toxin-antitoxin system PemK/MazF family toxin [Schinkia azotoformans]MEC1723296.1 type II toxin-antitoxin system PemK/MazF family toxin [Schinkia azotoformans]MEC1772225.1 type II toxin-antitoxin system PemK/MazF family toxin [Schinkia azotoformans]MEC1779083.1 type II toxin-antitoxin system PemK/MazF family toxin [Schink
MADSIFIDKSNWKYIKRGYFFQAAMYYLSDTEQPLRFLVSNDEGVLSIEERNGDFDPIILENGKKQAKEQDIIITVKPRQVIILSDDKINESEQFEYIQIAPVLGISDKDIVKPWYRKIQEDNLTGFAFIPRGENGIKVDLTQVTSIHKSMLLEKQSKVPTERMAFIDSQIVELLDL